MRFAPVPIGPPTTPEWLVAIERAEQERRAEEAAFRAEWSRCAPWIEAALEHAGTHTLADVEALVRTRECRFWAGREAALITEVQVWPQRKVLLLWLAGGDLDELRDELRPMAEAYGRDQGCDVVRISGRQGWVRALRGEGYEPVSWSCAKEL